MRGRKPKPNAIRRGGAAPTMVATVIDGEGQAISIRKPDTVSANAAMSECWDVTVSASPNFRPEDAPMLEQYCYWYSVWERAATQSMDLDGSVMVLDADGKPNPAIKVAERATNMLRQLGEALNVTPTARDRAGLMQAMTRSTQADVVNKTIEGYKRFKAETGAT